MDSTVPPAGPRPADETDLSVSPLDVAVGAVAYAVAATAAAGRRAQGVLGPVAGAVLRPPGFPVRLQPAHLLSVLSRHGAQQDVAIRYEVARLLDVLVPVVTEEVLRRGELAEMVARYVDVDRIVAAADLDVAASRLDADAVVRRVDLDAIIGRLDLTAIVLERVDLDTLVPAVIERIDLVALAEEVIDAIDLPDLIRESTGSMASETVHDVRMQSIAADETVGRVVDRLLLRRSRRPAPEPVRDTAPSPRPVRPTLPEQEPPAPRAAPVLRKP